MDFGEKSFLLRVVQLSRNYGLLPSLWKLVISKASGASSLTWCVINEQLRADINERAIIKSSITIFVNI